MSSGPPLGDAYSVELSAYGDPGDAAPAMVLADARAELPYGIGVSIVDAGRLSHAGEMDVAVAGEDNPTTAVPSVRVTRRDRDLCIDFTHDLVRLRKDGLYETVPAAEAAYRVRDGRLQRARCEAASP